MVDVHFLFLVRPQKVVLIYLNQYLGSHVLGQVHTSFEVLVRNRVVDLLHFETCFVVGAWRFVFLSLTTGASFRRNLGNLIANWSNSVKTSNLKQIITALKSIL